MNDNYRTYLKGVTEGSLYKEILLRSLPLFISRFVLEFLMFFSHLYNFLAFNMSFVKSILLIQVVDQIISALASGLMRHFCARVIEPMISQDFKVVEHEFFVFHSALLMLMPVVVVVFLSMVGIFRSELNLPNSYLPYYIIKVLLEECYNIYDMQAEYEFAIEKRRTLTFSRNIVFILVRVSFESMFYLLINYNELEKTRTNWPTYATLIISFLLALLEYYFVVYNVPFYNYINKRVITPIKYTKEERKQEFKSREFWKSVMHYYIVGCGFVFSTLSQCFIVFVAVKNIASEKRTDFSYLQKMFSIVAFYINEFMYASSSSATSPIFIEYFDVLFKNKYYRRINRLIVECLVIGAFYCVFPVILNIFYPPILKFMPSSKLFEELINQELNNIVHYCGIVYVNKILFEMVQNISLMLREYYISIVISVIQFVPVLVILVCIYKHNREMTDYVYIMIISELAELIICTIMLLCYYLKFEYGYLDDIDWIKRNMKKRKMEI